VGRDYEELLRTGVVTEEAQGKGDRTEGVV